MFKTDSSYIRLEHCASCPDGNSDAPRKQNALEDDLPVPPNQPFRADKHCCVVDYSLDLALLGMPKIM